MPIITKLTRTTGINISLCKQQQISSKRQEEKSSQQTYSISPR